MASSYDVQRVHYHERASFRAQIGVCVDCGDLGGPWGAREGTRGEVCEHCLGTPDGWTSVAVLNSIRYKAGYASPQRRGTERYLVAFDFRRQIWRVLQQSDVRWRALRTPGRRQKLVPLRFATSDGAVAFVRTQLEPIT